MFSKQSAMKTWYSTDISVKYVFLRIRKSYSLIYWLYKTYEHHAIQDLCILVLPNTYTVPDKIATETLCDERCFKHIQILFLLFYENGKYQQWDHTK